MSEVIARCYDDLSEVYHLLWTDWRQVVLAQGQSLGNFIREQFPDQQQISILDCCCGIGTQAIGLALQGFNVLATDLSSKAAERARREAASFGVDLPTGQADIRHLSNSITGTFDVLIAWDNSLSHLLSLEDVRLAAASVSEHLRPGGIFLASIRNYEILQAHRPAMPGSDMLLDANGRRVAFQVWDWAENGREYRQNYFVVHEREDGWHTIHYWAPGRCLMRRELNSALHDAGLTQIAWYVNESSYNSMSWLVATKT